MTSQNILYLWLSVFSLSLAVEFILDSLNISTIKKNSSQVPEEVKDFISADTYRRSVDYSLAKSKFGLVSRIYDAGLSFILVLSGLFGVFDSVSARLAFGPYSHGILFVLLMSFISAVCSLPFSWYGTFVLEEKFGFNRTTYRTWFLDMLKAAVLSVIIMSPLLAGLFWFMDTAGSRWWIYAFLFLSVFQLFLMFIYPVWIAPLFNKFSPLEEGVVKTAISDLAKRLQFENSGIYLMDGSRRSAHGNAYFTGFGKNRRIVLFDTLVKSMKLNELLAVLAHEIGHQKKNHVKKMLLLSLIGSLVVFYLLSLVVNYQPFFEAFGLNGPSYHGALVVFMVALSPLGIFLAPFGNMLSRRFEYQADRYSSSAMGEPKSLSDALITLSKENLSNLTPHPWYSFFHYSHPALLERLNHLAKSR